MKFPFKVDDVYIWQRESETTEGEVELGIEAVNRANIARWSRAVAVGTYTVHRLYYSTLWATRTFTYRRLQR